MLRLFLALLLACAASGKQPLDGQIITDPADRSWLKRQGGAPFFLAAPGDPEGFLYRGKRNPDGTRDGDQMAIIRKLARHGGNGIYLTAVRTHGGDAVKDVKEWPAIWPDALHNPWNGQDPRKGLNEALLRQWETWFAEMDRNGIVIYFFFYDDAINVAKRFGWELDARGGLHAEERTFIQALVKRFQHHRNLIWCVMEEGQEIGANWQRHISAIAEAIREADDHGHVIASHQLGGNIFFHAGDPNIAQFAIQTHVERVRTKEAFHNFLVEAWRLADGRYSLNMSEDKLHGELAEKGDRAAVRQRSWAAAMAGAYVMTLGLDGASTPEAWLGDLRQIQRFFEAVDLRGMGPADELKRGGTEYVLAAPGARYVLYSSQGPASLGAGEIKAGVYDLKWFDCVTGQTVGRKAVRVPGGDQAWPKPEGLGAEVALYAARRGATVLPKRAASPAARTSGAAANRVPEVEDTEVRTAAGRAVGIQLRYLDPDGGPGPYTITLVARPRNGELSGAGNDLTYTPRAGFTGIDVLRWKVHDGAGESRVAEVKIEVSYFPPPDAQGGWRKPANDLEARRVSGIDVARLDEVFRYIQGTTKNGGLLVARHGWLVYEKYFGLAHREANANTASCAKSFTSIAMGILLDERRDLFPEGLDQQVYNERYLPKDAFPSSDPAKAEIRLGQLLAMSAGIRGNNPSYVDGRRVELSPPGPDGSPACVDAMAFGFKDGPNNAITLWTKPGGGYSYATSSIHLVSVILRHVTGMEVDRFVAERLAKPMGWGRWGWGYQQARLAHTCGGGGIAPRPTDMLRFAYLLLREGRWGDRRLVPAEYVRLCGRRSPYNPHYPYSLQFNVNTDGQAAGAPRDAFWKTGSGGHAFYVAPSLDLVIWKFGGRDGQYNPKDTGIPAPPESVFRYDGSREGWKRTAAEEDSRAAVRTLEMVVAAVQDK